jgi:transcriptional regulator with XRE-family HTH domain
MAGRNALGEYLRARCELVDPASAGLPVVGVRRTPGLRREEVATLTGISVDYYLRLEQGRERNPSPQVLEALVRVFGLDAAAAQYLLGLVAARRRTRPRRPTVGVLHLRREKLSVGDANGQLLVIFHAEPGSDSARSLTRLGVHVVTDGSAPPRHPRDQSGQAGRRLSRKAAMPSRAPGVCDSAAMTSTAIA